MKTLSVLLCLFLTTSVFAAKSPIQKVQGKIYSFNEKTVVIESEGKKLEVPRSFIGTKKFKVGETVEAAFKDSEKGQIKVRPKPKKK